MIALHEALLGEVRSQPATAGELSARVGAPFVFVRSALATLCWEEKRAAPDGDGRWAEASPEQVMALRSA